MNTSRITRVEVFELNVGLVAPFRIALGVIDRCQNILVRIHTAEGTYGIGEGAPASFITGETQSTAFQAAKDLARLCVGQNPLEVEVRLSQLDDHLAHNTSTKCAFDVALHDLLAKRAGLPLYALLGGMLREIHTDSTVGIDDPDEMARQAVRISQSGFGAVKVKLGTGRQEDVARVRAIREAVGRTVILRIDANQGWDLPTAVSTLQDLGRFDIQYCEQPLPQWDFEGLSEVRRQSPIPITADESVSDHHDAFRLASMHACDYFNIKLAKSGGIRTALKINAIAEGAGMNCMVGCMFETRLGLAAAAHLMSARPNIAFANLDSAFFLAEDPVTGGVTFDGSRMLLSEAPGHGADIPQDFLEGMEHFCVTE